MTQAVIDSSVTDAELVRQARSGMEASYAELVRRWSARVLAVCHSRVRRRDIAEELAQETLLRGLQRLDSLESPDRFGPWLRGIAQRVCLDWLKAKQTGQVTFTELPSDRQPDGFLASNPDGAVECADELRNLMRHVEQLPDEFREVLMLYYYHDSTYQDLATLLGVSSATINSRLTKARALLRVRLTKLDTGRESRRTDDEV